MRKHFTLRNLGWLLTGIVAYMLGYGAVLKVLHNEEMVTNFACINLFPYLTLVGVVELVAIALLIVPKTSGIGALTISSIMSGAFVIHYSYMGGSGAIVPVIIGLMAWSAHCLRTHGCKLI